MVYNQKEILKVSKKDDILIEDDFIFFIIIKPEKNYKVIINRNYINSIILKNLLRLGLNQRPIG